MLTKAPPLQGTFPDVAKNQTKRGDIAGDIAAVAAAAAVVSNVSEPMGSSDSDDGSSSNI